MAILGGAKVEDKIPVIENLLNKADDILIGGAMAYTFLKAQGEDVGKSLVEDDKKDIALTILAKAAEKKVNFLLPLDHVLATAVGRGRRNHGRGRRRRSPPDMMGVDIGPKTVEAYARIIAGAKTIVWNGPLGVFEIDKFAVGTIKIAEAVAASGAISIVGGGDSIAAVKKAGVKDKITPYLDGRRRLARVPGLRDPAGHRSPGEVSRHVEEKPVRRRQLEDEHHARRGARPGLRRRRGGPGRRRRPDRRHSPVYGSFRSRPQLTEGTPVGLGGQNLHWEDRGAFTGEISGPMLKDAGCAYVVVGHSERRQFFGETDATVNKKARAALRHGLSPIVCVGETLEEREAGKTIDRIGTQLDEGLREIGPGDAERIVFAYEPVWAIGTGRTATPAQAEEVHAFIRTRHRRKIWKIGRRLCYNSLRRLGKAGQRLFPVPGKGHRRFPGRRRVPRGWNRSSRSRGRPSGPTRKSKRSEHVNHSLSTSSSVSS